MKLRKKSKRIKRGSGWEPQRRREGEGIKVKLSVRHNVHGALDSLLNRSNRFGKLNVTDIQDAKKNILKAVAKGYKDCK